MDLASLCAAFGLAAAAGLNAWLPLFAGALAQRLDLVELAQPFDELSGTAALAVLGVLTAGLTLAAFLVPVLAAVAVLALMAVLIVAFWRRRRRGG